MTRDAPLRSLPERYGTVVHLTSTTTPDSPAGKLATAGL